MYTNLQLLSGEYQKAWELTQKAILHKRFNNIQSADKETWKVFEAWLHFLIKKELIQLDPKEEKNIKKFRLNKFLNEVPSYSKDKSGLNIPILVVQMLFLLSNKQYKAINDRLEALEKYVVRHLKGPQNIRSNAFMKMLLQVGKCSFHLTAIERKTKRLHQKLLDTPLHSARQAHEIEIIPYETIWGWVVEALDRQFH